jgi:hypothetical protein
MTTFREPFSKVLELPDPDNMIPDFKVDDYDPNFFMDIVNINHSSACYINHLMGLHTPMKGGTEKSHNFYTYLSYIQQYFLGSKVPLLTFSKDFAVINEFKHKDDKCKFEFCNHRRQSCIAWVPYDDY